MGYLHSWIVGHVFGQSWTNQEVMDTLVWGAWIFTIGNFVFSLFMPAPYGKHGDTAPRLLSGKSVPDCMQIHFFKLKLCLNDIDILSAGRVNSKLAWFIQESPSLIIPFTLLVERWSFANWPQRILVLLVCLHYFQR